MKPGIKKFILRSLLALSPVVAYVALYVALDPFRIIRPYNGISIAPGDKMEHIPNKRFVAIEGLKYYNPQYHYDSFIFGSSISSNFTVQAWKRHLPPDACVYHFTAGANTLIGIRDELRYLIEHGIPVRHALLIMEDEMFQRKPRLNEMPYVPHPDVSQQVSWLHFHFVHFNAFRDPYMLLYNLMPWPWLGDKLIQDGKMAPIPSSRDEIHNEDSSWKLDSAISKNPREFYNKLPWLVDMKPWPNPMPPSIDRDNELILLEIAAMLNACHASYKVIVPPRFRTQPMSPIDHAALCEIMGQEHVNDFSGDSTLIHDLESYYDGIHIVTSRCTQMIDSCYSKPPFPQHRSTGVTPPQE